MRRIASLIALLFFAVPFGISLSGCSKSAPTDYCNGANNGLVVGQLTSIDLEPRLTGLSFNQGAIGSASTPSGKDCKGSSVTPTAVVYGTTNINLVDIVPASGRICAGSWNRNTGNIPDYTTCTPATTTGTAFITATSGGVVSNAIPVFVHPIVSSIILGSPSTNCTLDPASNCYTTTQVNACLTDAITVTNGYSGDRCVSQNNAAQLAARTFSGAANISCQVGPLTFSSTTPGIVTIDQNGIATAAAPGSTIINAATSQSSSNVGFFSTCPPKTITLTTVGSTTAPTAPITISQNVTQNLVATVLDTNNNPITNVALEYTSTNPVAIPATTAAITPTFPGTATITALCQPSSCNPSAFNQIGLYNNGTPTTSNPVIINATGTANSTILYIASTQSQYLQPIDFTLTTQPAPIRLPYAPNSMVLSNDLSEIYMGTPNEIMVLTVSNSSIVLSRQDIQLSGLVIAVAPNNGTVVVTDPTRNLIYLYSAGGTIQTQYGGVATRATFTPDSQTVYITTTDGRLLTYTAQTGWIAVPLASVASDVTVTVPNAGIYLGNGVTNPITARTNCPTVVTNGTGYNTTTSDTFYPLADAAAAYPATRVAATNDGVHILGATPTNFVALNTNAKSGACPVLFTDAPAANLAFTVAKPIPYATTNPSYNVSTATGAGIVDVLPTSDSAFAFVTYTGTGAVVPQYNVGTMALTNIPLQTTAAGTPIAPVKGVISTDNQTLYTGTSGDNVVHRLTRGTTGFTDTLTPVVPALPNINGGTTPATPDLLVQRPRKATS